MLAGIDRPTSGEIWINGAAIHTLNESALARWRGREVGVIFQFYQLFPTLSAVRQCAFCHGSGRKKLPKPIE